MAQNNVHQEYAGADRRRNKVFTTRNTAYYTCEGTCVGVLDLRTGRWLDGHLALGRRLLGGVRVGSDGQLLPVPSRPSVGDALYFADGERELITSVLCEVDRVPRDFEARVAFAS